MSIAATSAGSGIDFSQFKSQQIKNKQAQDKAELQDKKPKNLRELLNKDGLSGYEIMKIQDTLNFERMFVD